VRAAPTSAWVKALVVTLALAVVAAVAVAVILAVGVGRASNGVDALTPKPGRPAGYKGLSYPGMLTQDHVAGGTGAAGGQVNLLNEALTAGPLTRVAGVFGPTLCSAVTITNHSSAATDVGPVEWKLQQPNGIIETFALTGTLQGGQVAPGGQAGGNICFADTGQSGTFLLLWQPLFRVDRGVWLLHI
jgi:hypothetical protein